MNTLYNISDEYKNPENEYNTEYNEDSDDTKYATSRESEYGD